MNAITDNGAIGNGEAVSTAAIQRTIDACGTAGGGTVQVPPGCFRSGPLLLRSHVRLRLAPGAILRAIPDLDRWPRLADCYAGEQDGYEMYRPFLFAEDQVDVSVTGLGTIDGAGEPWWKAFLDGNLKPRRPRLLCFNGCRDVRIEGITAMNSPQWTINPVCCARVSIRDVRILNPHGAPNTDGINPDSCKQVRISDCHLDVGDDCIALKSGTESSRRPSGRQACEDIVIANCILAHGHGGVVCGSEMSGNVRNIAIANCLFRGTDRGLRFKTRRGRGGIIENVRAANLVMEDVAAPFAINLFYHCGAEGEPRVTDAAAWPVDAGTPRVERLHFSQITVRNAEYAAAYCLGLPEMPVRDITFANVDIHLRDDAREGQPDMAGTIPAMRRRGFVLRHVDGVSLSRVGLHGVEGPAVDADHCRRVQASDVESGA